MYNCVTQRRHYLESLQLQDMCRCGGRGWCSIYPLMAAFAWSLRALKHGRRPPARHDESPWHPTDPIRQLEDEYGSMLPKAILLWLKGDWSEASHSLGLPSVRPFHCPCPFCAKRGNRLHSQYRVLEEQPRGEDYDDLCDSREIRVLISTEADRRVLLGAMRFRKTRGFGR